MPSAASCCKVWPRARSSAFWLCVLPQISMMANRSNFAVSSTSLSNQACYQPHCLLAAFATSAHCEKTAKFDNVNPSN